MTDSNIVKMSWEVKSRNLYDKKIQNKGGGGKIKGKQVEILSAIFHRLKSN